MLISLQGCMQYYKVKKVSTVTAQEMDQFIARKRFIIIHQDSTARYLSNARMTSSVLTGELVNLTENQMKFKSTKPKGATRYRNNMIYKEKYVTNEVHRYLHKHVIKDFGTAHQVMIPMSDISYTDVYLKAKGRTIFSWVYPVILYYAVAYGIIIVVVIAFGNNLHFDLM